MLFLEILLSIHGLLLVSSWVIGRAWLANQPSLKLRLVRLLLISCVISPFIVHGIHSSQKPVWRHYASIDVLQDYAYKPILKTKSPQEVLEAETTFSFGHTSYIQLFYLLFCLLIAFRCYQAVSSLSNLRTLLAKAIPYKRFGKLIITISDRCHIPFSVVLYNKAYIVLPVSLFSSSKNVMIAITHEGQHHRNGDCLWAYFTQSLRIIFGGNPGVSRWNSILNELQELSCDEVLVGLPKISPYDYGRCLFDVVQTASQSSLSSHQEIACTVGMALGKDNKDSTFIIRRITMLSAYPGKPSKSLALGVAVVGFSILAPVLAAYSAVGTLTGSKVKEIDTSHLDSKMQVIAEQEIKKAVKQYHAKSGSIAIANAKTGDIIAFAEVSDGKNHSSWKTRVFAPGSTIKPFIAAAAIDSGKSSETKTYNCHSPYLTEGRTFADYYASKVPLSLTQAMAKSSNVCLIKVSQETGLPVIRKKLTEFGFDMDSWKQENQTKALQLAMIAVGGNIPVTMDSLTKSYAILANEGRPFKAGEAPVVSATTIHSINHILEHVVNRGTGKFAVVPGVRVAGKTGTVEASGENLALFAGYLPVNAPRYAMVVMIENGHLDKNGKILTSGGELAAPIFRQVAINSLSSTKP